MIVNTVDSYMETVFTTDMTNEPHQYVAEGPSQWRTCAVCGRGANAGIHKATAPQHTTHINHLPHLGKWQPYCDLCGTIGRGEDYENDAIAIAERHAEIGGFG